MSILLKSDYFTLIREDVLDVVIEDDVNFLDAAEAAAEVEMISYLNARYDTAALFKELKTYTIAAAFAIGDFVHLSAPAYAGSTVYQVGTLVSFTDGNVYKVIQLTTGAEAPISDPTFFEEWGVNNGFYTSLVAETGAKPADVLKFTPGDTRNPLIVRYLVDLVVYELHSRIQPRMVPELRTTRRDDVITWLQGVANPRNDMSPNFPLKTFEENQDNTLVWGSNDKLSHSY